MQEEILEVIESKDSVIRRRARSLEGRSFQSRSASERPALNYASLSKFNVPKEVLDADPDHYYSYINARTPTGENLKQNFYDAVDRGYKAVPPSAHPSLARNYHVNPFGDRGEESQFIERGCAILMKRPIDLHKQENARYDSEHQRDHEMAELYRSGASILQDHRTRSRATY